MLFFLNIKSSIKIKYVKNVELHMIMYNKLPIQGIHKVNGGFLKCNLK